VDNILVADEGRLRTKVMRIAVLSDFDGTLTSYNGLDILYREFGAPSYKQVVERWDRGEISTMEEISTCFSTMPYRGY
jgi:2-hydroxy-3-keto-5-methylthiopentenyl-1-phosphate phosphatase